MESVKLRIEKYQEFLIFASLPESYEIHLRQVFWLVLFWRPSHSGLTEQWQSEPKRK
jgi:hypothetical protein